MSREAATSRPNSFRAPVYLYIVVWTSWREFTVQSCVRPIEEMRSLEIIRGHENQCARSLRMTNRSRVISRKRWESFQMAERSLTC
jgi:hypothetical protein